MRGSAWVPTKAATAPKSSADHEACLEKRRVISRARVTGGLNSSGRRSAALSRDARCSRNTRSTANDSPVAMATGQRRKSSPRLLCGKGEVFQDPQDGRSCGYHHSQE